MKSPRPFDTLFDSHRWAPFSLVLQLCSSKVITKWCKIYTKSDSRFQKSYRNLDNFRQVVKSPKSRNSMGYICLKTTFRQLKHYIQKIYLALLSTTCVKIRQIPYLIFEARQSFFTTLPVYIIIAKTLRTFDKNIPSKYKFSDCSLLKLKLIKYIMSFFKQKVSFSLNFVLFCR